MKKLSQNKGHSKLFIQNANEAITSRTNADQLFSFIDIDPLDKDWKKKVDKIINEGVKKGLENYY